MSEAAPNFTVSRSYTVWKPSGTGRAPGDRGSACRSRRPRRTGTRLRLGELLCGDGVGAAVAEGGDAEEVRVGLRVVVSAGRADPLDVVRVRDVVREQQRRRAARVRGDPGTAGPAASIAAARCAMIRWVT